MYALPAFTISALLLASLSAAAPLTKRDSLGSPFNLTINSVDGSIVEYKLGACHSEAGGEVLCAYPGVSSPFNFNSSTGYDETGDGYLVYQLEASPSPVYQNAVLGQTVNNVAYMSFGYEAAPGYPSEFAFEEDTLTAVTDQTSGGSNLTDPHFWLCNYSNGGYNYSVVAYTLDDAEPQADNCTAVSVNRRTPQA